MTAPYRILVTGSRDWKDAALACTALAEAAAGVPGDGVVLVSGTARGADTIAELYAGAQDWAIERHPADWERFGRGAGRRRNAEMVKLGADVCLCFVMPCSGRRCTLPRPHDSHGTAHCAGLAEKAGIPVRRFTSPGGAW